MHARTRGHPVSDTHTHTHTFAHTHTHTPVQHTDAASQPPSDLLHTTHYTHKHTPVQCTDATSQPLSDTLNTRAPTPIHIHNQTHAHSLTHRHKQRNTRTSARPPNHICSIAALTMARVPRMFQVPPATPSNTLVSVATLATQMVLTELGHQRLAPFSRLPWDLATVNFTARPLPRKCVACLWCMC